MTPRLAACHAISGLLQQHGSLASLLPPLLDKVEARERGFLQELVYGTCRLLPRLQTLAALLLDKPFKKDDSDLQALLLCGLYQLYYLRIPAHAAVDETVALCQTLKKPWAKGALNAVLRRAQREQESLLLAADEHDSARYAHPGWLLKRLKKDWPEHWQSICAGNNAQAPMSLRVNAQHGSRDDYLARLNSANIAANACEHAPFGITLQAPCDVQQLPGFADGHVSVQDEAAQLAADLLEAGPGQRVLDACCAPGGKTCHVLEQQPVAMQALDLEPERLARVADNLARLKLAATLTAADARDTHAWWDGQPFQRILLDAPCSATGVIRRHPDIKLLRKASDIQALSVLQLQLLQALWPTLEVGGILLYATCSVLPAENSQVIAQFLQQTPSARELDMPGHWGHKQAHGRQLFAQENGHDGFYYAKLIKISAA
ncbi:16S rRNA (cytosine(967)-C(5))-methyltransferase RsmB [Atopomonas sediminilitoris]|uniref:16S rRNA (cytosine(967)-C(5))-methyltransferase RsmB n=1 Tax=Atopomonas sediminilitoris TaxID=2919919 RepID=UPI001F4DEBBD|nr:16S rRNA (cytosine(967)-C(5))-methyltransferase RsmB [Atopomonas sediminilitoris]MCJ8169368.1 16S rRNA (cytosine(967)-C(5))-methyltransferase RsmB [Atopomonas sediminilitoris]